VKLSKPGTNISANIENITSFVNSSGNVFIDLGYSPDEVAILQIRADLKL